MAVVFPGLRIAGKYYVVISGSSKNPNPRLLSLTESPHLLHQAASTASMDSHDPSYEHNDYHYSRGDAAIA